jgi:hypothetical protein
VCCCAPQPEEVKRISREQERLAAEERRRRDAVIAEATRWNSAQLLRNYIAHAVFEMSNGELAMLYRSIGLGLFPLADIGIEVSKGARRLCRTAS